MSVAHVDVIAKVLAWQSLPTSDTSTKSKDKKQDSSGNKAKISRCPIRRQNKPHYLQLRLG